MKETGFDVVIKQKREGLRGAVLLWGWSSEYETLFDGEYICLLKDGKTISFVYEIGKSTEELLFDIYKVKENCDYVYVVIDDERKRGELNNIIPEYCGIFCYSNAFGNGQVIQILKACHDVN